MVVKEDRKKIGEEELRSLLESYRLKDGEIVSNDEFPQENDTIEQDQRVSVPQVEENLPARKTNFEKKNEYLLEVKDDIPDHIYNSGSHWVSISKHNQLLKLDKAGIASAKLGTI